MLTVRDTGTGIPDARAAAAVRALPSGRRAPAVARSRAAASASPWCRSWSGSTAVRSVPRARRAAARTFTVTPAVRLRPTCRPTDRRREAPQPRARSRAQAYVAEALRWLPDGIGEAVGYRPMRRGSQHSRRRRRQRVICWPTTTPTCATMCGACWRPRLRGRGGGRRRGGAGGGPRSKRPISCSPTS